MRTEATTRRPTRSGRRKAAVLPRQNEGQGTAEPASHRRHRPEFSPAPQERAQRAQGAPGPQSRETVNRTAGATCGQGPNVTVRETRTDPSRLSGPVPPLVQPAKWGSSRPLPRTRGSPRHRLSDEQNRVQLDRQPSHRSACSHLVDLCSHPGDDSAAFMFIFPSVEL